MTDPNPRPPDQRRLPSHVRGPATLPPAAIPLAAILLAAILLAGLVLRLGWGLTRPSDDAAMALLPDQRGYLDLGRNLLHGRGLHYVDTRFGPVVDGVPAGQTVYAARTPGYPAFIALCGGSVAAVRVVQALVDLSTALAVFLLARRLFPRGSAPLLAAAAVAFNPFLIYFSALLLTETLYTALLAWAMVLFVSRRAWPVGVALLAAGVAVRPSGIGLPIVLAGVGVFVRYRCDGQLGSPRPLGRAVLATILGAALTFAVLLPWAWRNSRVVGRWLFSTSNDGITAYDGFHPGARGNSDQRFLKQMPHVTNIGELERSDYFAAAAKRFALDHPSRVVQLTFAKTARTWSPVPLSEEFGRPLYRVAALLYALPFDLLVIVGLFSRRLTRATLVLLLAPALYFTAVHALSVGSLRYRVPAEPPLAVLAAAGLSRLLSTDRHPRANEEGDPSRPPASPSAVQ